jgi:hypothetical protein
MATKPSCWIRISSPPGPFFWDTDQLAGRSCHDRRTRRCRQIDAMMVGARLGWFASTRGPNGEEMHAGLTGGTSISLGCGSALAPAALRPGARTAAIPWSLKARSDSALPLNSRAPRRLLVETARPACARRSHARRGMGSCWADDRNSRE